MEPPENSVKFGFIGGSLDLVVDRCQEVPMRAQTIQLAGFT
jgi:hypothetical protein